MALVRILKLIMVCVLTTSAAGAFAFEIEKVNFPDQVERGGQKLQLNGAGLRNKRKLGMQFRVYVAALYTVEKSSDAKAVIGADSPKELRLHFLRAVDADTLREAWTEGYGKNCADTCATTADQLKAFNSAMADVRDGSTITMRFGKDKVAVETDGKEKKSAEIAGADFHKNLLAVFIGDNPPTEELKKGLLGVK